MSSERYAIAMQVREFFLDAQASLREDIKYGGLVFLRDKELLSGIFFYQEHMSIEFAKGIDLSDPNSILEGKGKSRRHIKIRTEEELQTKNIKTYINQSLRG
ncbi:MAG: hypothetical protein ACI88A_003916 [Paraglaciecola sp.]